MKLSQLAEEYYFHDSSLEHARFDEAKKEVVLDIELCTWMQTWYSEETDAEIETIRLFFKNVMWCDLSDFKASDYDEIVDVELLPCINGAEGIKIHIESENNYQMITIYAGDVQVIKGEPNKD